MGALTRRGFIGSVAATGATLGIEGVEGLEDAEAEVTAGPFLHGVASGDPLSDRVLLWTRVSGSDGEPVSVFWRVATDPELTDVVGSGTVVAVSERDFTVHVDVDRLRPATTYYYGFHAFGENSTTGRTRTAPAGSADHLRFAVVSCSRTWSGWFTAYRRIAERADLDLIIHCGDYIYDEPNREQLVRPNEPEDYEIPKTLEQYRRRHADYKLDRDLQRAHQQHPWIITWDNHDVGNGNVWAGGGAGEAERSPAWYARKARAIQAFLEWNPIRLPDPGDGQRVFRELPYGDLVDILVLDTRLAGRDKPVGSSGQTITSEEIDDPQRTMLGAAQYDWLTGRLAASKGRGTRWRLLVNQVLMGQWNAGGLPSTNGLDIDIALRDGGNAFNPIAWDGYTAERARLFDFLEQEAITDNVVVSGDLHCSFANDLIDDPYNPTRYDIATGGRSVGVEFLPSSVTSGNFDEEYDLEQAPQAAAAVSAGTLANNPHIRLAEFREHGYGLVDLTPERTVGEFWWVDILRPDASGERLGAAYQTRRGEDHLEALPLLEPTPSRAGAAPPAPDAPPRDDPVGPGPAPEDEGNSPGSRPDRRPESGGESDRRREDSRSQADGRPGGASAPPGEASGSQEPTRSPGTPLGFRIRGPRDVARSFVVRRGLLVRVYVTEPGYVRVLLRVAAPSGREVTILSVLRRVPRAGTYSVRLRPGARALGSRGAQVASAVARFVDARGRKRTARWRSRLRP